MTANTEYDLAFSLGQACACSTTLRAARLQFASFPFDWLSNASLEERTAEGITEIRFDYHNDMTDVNCSLTSKALVALGVSVRDYRTETERRAYKLRKNMKKYNVDTRFGLFLAKAKERLCRLFAFA